MKPGQFAEFQRTCPADETPLAAIRYQLRRLRRERELVERAIRALTMLHEDRRKNPDQLTHFGA